MLRSNKDLIVITNNSIRIDDYKGSLSELPGDLFEGITSIESLSIYAPNLVSIPESLNKIIITKSADIGNSKISQLTKGIFHGSIESLKIDSSQFRFDETFSQLKDLKSLTLSRFYGKKWPIVLENLPRLENLYLLREIGKKLSHDKLIEGIVRCRQLKQVDLPFKLDLNLVGDSLRKLNYLKSINFYTYGLGDGWENIGLLDELSLNPQAFVNHEIYQSLVKGKKYSNEKLKEIYAVHTKKIGFLTSKNPNILIEKEERGELKEMSFAYRPSNLMKAQCKEHLSHIVFSQKSVSKGSNYIISAKSKLEEVFHIFESDLEKYTEDQLKKLIEYKSAPWLLEKSSSDTHEQLYNLLASNQAENIIVALEIMEGGGATEDLLSMLAVLMMAHPDKVVKQSAEKLFKKIGPSSTYHYLKTCKISLRTSGNTLSKLNNLFNQERGLNEITFRIFHCLVAGQNPNIKDARSFELNFKDYQFKKPIPEVIKYFNNITNINFENAQLFEVEKSLKHIAQLDSLRNLNLSKSKTILDKNTQFSTSLVELNLSSCDLKDVSILGNLKKLKALDVTSTEIKDWLFLNNLPNLMSFAAGRNKLKKLPDAIVRHRNIINLDLSYNYLSIVDELFVKKYIYLNLNNNKLLNLSSKITDIEGLQTLYLRSNKLTSEFVTNVAVNENRSILDMDLSSNEIETFKIEKGQLSTLDSLNLSKNNLSQIDPTVFLNTDIKNLNVSNNNISSIPEEITFKPKFKRLNFSHNKIEKLEAFIDKISVENFDLKNNQIKEVSHVLKKGDRYLTRTYWNMDYNPLPYRF